MAEDSITFAILKTIWMLWNSCRVSEPWTHITLTSCLAHQLFGWLTVQSVWCCLVVNSIARFSENSFFTVLMSCHQWSNNTHHLSLINVHTGCGNEMGFMSSSVSCNHNDKWMSSFRMPCLGWLVCFFCKTWTQVVFVTSRSISGIRSWNWCH